MADDAAGGLLVQIGVTQARMERQMAALVKGAAKSAGDMEKSFTAANNNISKSGSRAFDGLTRGATSAAPAVKNLSGYTANLASQLNDITVQLAGGQSPFQIMLQQGTQIGQIATQAGGGFKALGSIAASAFASVLSPVNLATFALIGLGGAAVQYFAGMLSGGEDSKKTLEDQTKLIQDVAKTWGDAVPALKDYVDQLERAKNVGDLQQVVANKTQAALGQLNVQMNTFSAANTNMLDLLSKAAKSPNSALHDLGASYQTLQAKMLNVSGASAELQKNLKASADASESLDEKTAANTATAADYQKAQDATNKVLKSRQEVQAATTDLLGTFQTVQAAATNAAATTGYADVVKFSSSFDTLAGSVTGTLALLGQFTDQAKDAINTAADLQASQQDAATGGTFNDNGATRRTSDFIPKGDVPTPGNRPDDDAQFEATKKSLEDQAALVDKLVDAYGGLLPALADYSAAAEDARNAVLLQDAVQNQQIATWNDARESLYSFNDANSAFIDLMSKASTNTDDPLNKLAVAYDELQQKVLLGTATSEDFQKVTNATTEATANGVTGLGDFQTAFETLTGGIMGAIAQLLQFQTQANSVLNTASKIQANIQDLTTNPKRVYDDNGVTRPVPNSPEGTVLTDSGGYVPIPKPEDRPSPESIAPPKVKKAAAARGAHAYDDEVTNIKDRTTALQAQTAAQAAINPLVNDFGYALEKAKTEQALLADAQKSGVTITPQLREQISALADTYAKASAASKQLADAQEDIRKKAAEWADLEKDTFKGFLSDLKDGKSGAEALSNALNKVADKLLDMAVDSLFSTKGSTSGGGNIIGSAIGGIGKLLGFASGTANTGSRPGTPVGIVHGQEAVIPLPSGGRVPVTIAAPKASAQKNSNDTVTLRLQDDSGRMADIANQQIKTASGTIVKVAVSQSYKQVKGSMSGLMSDAQARNG